MSDRDLILANMEIPSGYALMPNAMAFINSREGAMTAFKDIKVNIDSSLDAKDIWTKLLEKYSNDFSRIGKAEVCPVSFRGILKELKKDGNNLIFICDFKKI